MCTPIYTVIIVNTHALTNAEPHSIIHEGWCVKESGTALFGKTNWRRRWFRLVQTRRDILLQYYRSDTQSCHV